MKAARIALILFLVCGVLLGTAAPALAELLVIPIRVAFEPRDRAQAVTLINTSQTTNTYRLEWKYFRMQESGSMVEIPAEKWTQTPKAGDMIKIAPRQITIPPQGRQVVRLSLRRPAELADGEYRAYLSITRLADMSTVKKQVERKGTGIALGVNLNLNLPVVVKQGSGEAAGKIGAVSFAPPSHQTSGRPALKVELLQQHAAFSPYGKLNIFWQQPGGEEKRIGFVENAYIYPEVEKRLYTIPLNVASVQGGSLRLEYVGTREYEGQLFDKKIIPVGQ